MNSIDFIIKYKLWTLAKQTGFHDLDQSVENYVYEKANFDMLEDIKTDEVLKKYLIKLINSEYEYKHEKKMFTYLLNNMSHENFTKVINTYPHNYLLLQFTKRSNKNINFEFLQILDSTILKNGTFLNYSLGQSEKLVEYAININESSTFNITEKIQTNLLLSKEIKGKLKIKLLTKFLDVVKKDINQYFMDSIDNNDEVTALWFITNFKDSLIQSSERHYNFLRCHYNELMEKMADNYFDIVFDNNNHMFISNFFEKVVIYKKESYEEVDISILDKTLNKFAQWGIKFNTNDSKSVVFKIVTMENIDFLLENQSVLNIKKETISIESLLHKLLYNNENTITNDQLKNTIDKIYEHKFSQWDRGSNAMFLEYVNKENLKWLFSHKLFSYNVEKLLSSLYNRNKDLALDLSQLIDKNIVWNFVQTLNKKERVEFELNYYDDKYNDKEKIKRLKI